VIDEITEAVEARKILEEKATGKKVTQQEVALYLTTLHADGDEESQLTEAERAKKTAAKRGSVSHLLTAHDVPFCVSIAFWF